MLDEYGNPKPVHELTAVETVKDDVRVTNNIFTKDGAKSMDAIIPALLAGGNQGGGAMGAGLGAGVLGGVLGGALLNGNGIGGNRNAVNEGVVTPAVLAASLANVTDTLQNTTVLQTLGDIKASVPLAEGQVQLALAGVQSDLTTQANINQTAVVAGQATINKNISDAIAASLASQNNINQNVSAQGTLNLIATKDSQYATAVAISNSTKELLAALNSQNMADLQRQLGVAESALLESRSIAREHVNTLNITNTNTNTALALQSQTQAQAQSQAIIQLAAELRNLSGDIQAVRQGQVTFNSGTMTGAGNQTAANTKVG